MEIKINIGFEQLLEMVRTLPATQLSMLKTELQKQKESDLPNGDIKTFLLKAPVFKSKELDAIASTRKAINKWRTN